MDRPAIGTRIEVSPAYQGSGRYAADAVSQGGPWYVLAYVGPADYKIGRVNGPASEWEYIIHESRISR